MPTYDERFQSQLAQRRKMADARERFINMIYTRMEAEELQRQQEEDQAEAAEKKNWFNDASSWASKGSAIGGAIGPGAAAWGALIGGIAGTVKGQGEAYGQRRKEGQGRMEAFGNTSFDTPFGEAGDVGVGVLTGGANNALRKGTTGEWSNQDQGVQVDEDFLTNTAAGGMSYVGAYAKEQRDKSKAGDGTNPNTAGGNYDLVGYDLGGNEDPYAGTYIGEGLERPSNEYGYYDGDYDSAQRLRLEDRSGGFGRRTKQRY